jgi:hypothetical protein
MHSSKISKTLAQALARHADKIDDYWMEEDQCFESGDWSIWIYLKPEWENGHDPGCGTIHEGTVKDAIAVLRAIQPTTLPRD